MGGRAGFGGGVRDVVFLRVPLWLFQWQFQRVQLSLCERNGVPVVHRVTVVHRIFGGHEDAYKRSLQHPHTSHHTQQHPNQHWHPLGDGHPVRQPCPRVHHERSVWPGHNPGTLSQLLLGV